MKKIITILSVLMCMTVACSDDEDTKDYPELPDRDLDISVPVVPADWEPGMAYKPYDAGTFECGCTCVGCGRRGTVGKCPSRAEQ